MRAFILLALILASPTALAQQECADAKVSGQADGCIAFVLLGEAHGDGGGGTAIALFGSATGGNAIVGFGDADGTNSGIAGNGCGTGEHIDMTLVGQAECDPVVPI